MDENFQPQPERPLQLKPTPRRSPFKVFFGGLFYILFLGIIFAVATGASWVKQSPLMVTIMGDAIRDSVGMEPRKAEEVFHNDTLTLLILGCDQNLGDTYSRRWKERVKREFLRTGVRPHISRDISKDTARTDMMLVAKLDFTNHTISGLSIPRDLEVSLPGYHAQKINGYYTYGKGDTAVSEQITKEAVEFVLPGVHIDRVVTLDYDAFQNVVNMVGGVPVNIEKDLEYVDVGGDLFIDLKKGPQVLDGYNAMCFVRFRKADSDFKRQERQKDLLVSLKKQLLSTGNIFAIPQVVEQAKLVLGRALTDDEIAGLAMWAKGVPSTGIKLGMVPIRESSRSTNLYLDEDKLPEVMGEFGLNPSYQAARSAN
jgi:LCP family protein required for cell wall assembly